MPAFRVASSQEPASEEQEEQPHSRWIQGEPKLETKGWQQTWQQHGISLEGAIVTQLTRPFSGGLRQASSSTTLLDLTVALNLERLFGWRGARLGLDYYYVGGDEANSDVGSLQGVSDIDSPRRSQLAELWYEQLLFDKHMRLKLGKLDVNSEFAFVKHGGEFVHPASGITSALNLTAPTYPDPSTSFNLFVRAPGWKLALGAFDGATNAGTPTGSHGPGTFLGKPSDLFYVAQLDHSWTLGASGLPGRLGVGYWKHSGDFAELDGGTTRGTDGQYLVLDHELWREHPELADDDQGWAGFLVLGLADQGVSDVASHVGLGFVRTGWLEVGAADVGGVALQRAEYSGPSAADEASELNLELFYRRELNSWCSLKPDLQYIRNPGGSSDAQDAWLVAVRLEVRL